MDDFETEVRAMLQDRAATIPNEYDADPALARKVRRRRNTKIGLLGGSACVLAIVAGAVLVSAGDGGDTPVVSSDLTPDTTTSVPDGFAFVVGCDTSGATTGESSEEYVLYAADIEPANMVLGPVGWSCRTETAADGPTILFLAPDTDELDSAAVITVANKRLGDVATAEQQACLWQDPAINRWAVATAQLDECAPDPVPEFVTPNVSKLTYPDGTKEVAIANRTSADDAPELEGTYAVMTCHPAPADCDRIIDDFIERNTNPNGFDLPPTDVMTALADVGVDVANAPVTAQTFEGAEFCGLEERRLSYDNHNGPARRCFLAAVEAGTPATMVIDTVTVEGDPIVSVYSARPDRTIVWFHDATRDRFGSGTWTTSRCTEITQFPESPLPEYFFEPSECTEIP